MLNYGAAQTAVAASGRGRRPAGLRRVWALIPGGHKPPQQVAKLLILEGLGHHVIRTALPSMLLRVCLHGRAVWGQAARFRGACHNGDAHAGMPSIREGVVACLPLAQLAGCLPAIKPAYTRWATTGTLRVVTQECDGGRWGG